MEKYGTADSIQNVVFSGIVSTKNPSQSRLRGILVFKWIARRRYIYINEKSPQDFS
jgi:hypothetical protein